ncbi:unnamed protein product [Protopolystoma xenopodis]|uniref:Uncharacterized protein n=1 Tax=Protopolystoma xenopodis TaxID=117903 RepID=A0A3S5A8G1_9PLAT|nr:unnamed protein product [Protopolystoma xenopodis]
MFACVADVLPALAHAVTDRFKFNRFRLVDTKSVAPHLVDSAGQLDLRASTEPSWMASLLSPSPPLSLSLSLSHFHPPAEKHLCANLYARLESGWARC